MINQAQSLNPLANLEDTIRKHWQKFLPKMFNRLEQTGELDDKIAQAAQWTIELVNLTIQTTGASMWEAWEVTRETYAILPAEDEDE